MGLSPDNPGIWVAYQSDGSAAAMFATEVEALRYALDGFMQVMLIPLGEDIFTWARNN